MTTRRPAILKRFPSIRSTAASTPVLPKDVTKEFPVLAADLEVLGRIVEPAFAESDRAALRFQNAYRRQQVILIVGSTLLSALGALQAALSEQSWPGIALAIIGIVLAALGQTAKELKTFELFLEERVKAERLRAMHFRYLSRTGRYAGADRSAVLERAVLAVKNGQEPQ